jgi:hypothetical protein
MIEFAEKIKVMNQQHHIIYHLADENSVNQKSGEKGFEQRQLHHICYY